LSYSLKKLSGQGLGLKNLAWVIKTVTDKEQEWINEYETRREKERGKQDRIIGEIVESFEPLIKANLEYLKYARLKGWMKVDEKEEICIARHNAVTSVIGRYVKWAIKDARDLVFGILEEVNDHKMAEKVSVVLEG